MLKKALFTLFSIGCAALSFAAVNVNTATVDELDKQLTGIGPAKARAIVEYREKNGPFKSVDDLAKVPGIKEATINKFNFLIIFHFYLNIYVINSIIIINYKKYLYN